MVVVAACGSGTESTSARGETDGVAARVLSSLGVELPKVRSAVEFIIGRGGRPSPGDVGLTPRAKTVIELAVAEARGLGHGYIGAIDDLAWKTRDPRRFYLLGTRELHTGTALGSLATRDTKRQ